MLTGLKLLKNKKKLIWKNNFRSNKCSEKCHKITGKQLSRTVVLKKLQTYGKSFTRDCLNNFQWYLIRSRKSSEMYIFFWKLNINTNSLNYLKIKTNLYKLNIVTYLNNVLKIFQKFHKKAPSSESF